MSGKSRVIITLLAVCCTANVVLALGSPAQLRPITADESVKIEQAAPAKATAAPAKPRKVLVFWLCTGFFHESIPLGNKAIEVIGKKTGAWEAVASNDMAMFNADKLGQFDAVLLNNTTKLPFKDAAQKQALLDFVKNGKSIIGIHAATDNFYDWREAAEMMGGIFDGHPWTSEGTWAVKNVAPGDVLNAGFKGQGFKIKEEIYRVKDLGVGKNYKVLLALDLADKATRDANGVRESDQNMPVSWYGSYGKGRVFYSGIGHNNEIFWNPAVLQHYLDGIQYALGDLKVDSAAKAAALAAPIGPGNIVEVEDLLGKIKGYDFGQSRENLTRLSDIIRDSASNSDLRKQIEKRLAAFLGTDATYAAKQFACRQLALIGTEGSVAALAPMLTNDEYSDMARYALEPIPGTAVDEALRKALGEAQGKTKVGIINTLGVRKDTKAVASLAELVGDANQMVASAAVAALGRIADKAATDALAKAKDKLTGVLQTEALDAYLKCADRIAASGDKAAALAIYDQVYGSSAPATIRTAALRGRIINGGDKATAVVVDVLKGKDQAMQTAAIGILREVAKTDTIKAAAEQLPNLSVTSQVQLLAALSDCGDKVASAPVASAAKHSDESVRVAALSALANLGDVSTVDMLVQTAATASGAEQSAARESLYRLRGADVDKTILDKVASASPEVKAELIKAIDQRNTAGSVPILVKLVGDGASKVRVEAIKALRTVAAPSDMAELVNLLVTITGDAERSELEKTVVAVSRKIPEDKGQGAAVLAALPSAKELTARTSLMSVLGRIGDPAGLKVLRDGLKDEKDEVKDAGVRALSDWPSAAPAEDLLNVVKTSANEVHRTLALRGYVRLIGLESDRPIEQTIGMYKEAMSLAPNVAEKKMVLSGLGTKQTWAAMEMAVEYLTDENLKQEAEAAVVKIAEGTLDDHKQETRALLEKVRDTTTVPTVRERATQMLRR